MLHETVSCFAEKGLWWSISCFIHVPESFDLYSNKNASIVLTLVKRKKEKKKKRFSGKRLKKGRQSKAIRHPKGGGKKTSCCLGLSESWAAPPAGLSYPIRCNASACLSRRPPWLGFLPSVKFPPPIQFQIKLPPTSLILTQRRWKSSWPLPSSGNPSHGVILFP